MITHSVRAIRASVKIEDGNWTVEDDGDATLYLKESEVEILDPKQPQVELVAQIGEDTTATLDLSCEDVDALAAVLADDVGDDDEERDATPDRGSRR